MPSVLSRRSSEPCTAGTCPRGRTSACGKADLAAYLVVAWEVVSDGAIQHGRECNDPGTTRLEGQLQEAVGQ